MFYLKLVMLLLTSFTKNTNITGVKSFPVTIEYNYNNDINYNYNDNSDINYSDINDIPVVVLHGVASSAVKMDGFSDWISKTFNRTVFNIEIGNGESTSLYTPLPEQLFLLCNTLYSIKKLEDGFDFIGMSQGGYWQEGM